MMDFLTNLQKLDHLHIQLGRGYVLEDLFGLQQSTQLTSLTVTTVADDAIHFEVLPALTSLQNLQFLNIVRSDGLFKLVWWLHRLLTSVALL
jgi:hypothetical protein